MEGVSPLMIGDTFSAGGVAMESRMWPHFVVYAGILNDKGSDSRSSSCEDQ